MIDETIFKNKYCALCSIYGGDDPGYFRLALESVVNQTAKIPIYIVVDGPISAEYRAVLEKAKTDIERIFWIAENGGLGNALNHGVMALKDKYDYVIRFDSDDINHEERFHHLILAIEKVGYDLLGSYIDECAGYELEESISTRKVPLADDEIVSSIWRRNPFNHPSVAFRVTSVIEAGGYEEVAYFEDWYLWAKMIAKGSVVGNLGQSLVRFRYGDEMLGRRRGMHYMACELSFYRKLSKLKLVNQIKLVAIMLLRISTRILPEGLFGLIYRWQRKFL